MTEGKGSIFVEYTIVAVVHMIYYGEVIPYSGFLSRIKTLVKLNSSDT